MTAKQIKSLYVSDRISRQAAHTMLRAIGYTDIEADDILYDTPRQRLADIEQAREPTFGPWD